MEKNPAVDDRMREQMNVALMTQVKIIDELKAEITEIEKYNGNQIETEFQKVSN